MNNTIAIDYCKSPFQYSFELYKINDGKPAVRFMEEKYKIVTEERIAEIVKPDGTTADQPLIREAIDDVLPTPTIEEIEASMPADDETVSINPTKCICSQRSGLVLDQHQIKLEKFGKLMEGA